MTERRREPSDDVAALDLRILRRSDYFMFALAQAHGTMLLRRTAATFPDIPTRGWPYQATRDANVAWALAAGSNDRA